MVSLEREEKQSSCCSALGHLLRSEGKCSAFTFAHPNPIEFAWPQWKFMEWIGYAVYRIIVATLLLISLIIEIPVGLTNKNPFVWLTFATNWSVMFITFTVIGFAIYSTYYTFNRNKAVEVHGNKVLWFFYAVFANCIAVVSGAYWIAIWDVNATANGTEPNEFQTTASMAKHSVPALIVIIDLLINNMPVRLLHFIYPSLLGIFYAVFSYIYFLTGLPGIGGVGIIYPALDWKSPGDATLVCVLAVLLCTCIQVFLFCIYALRVLISYKVGGRGGCFLEHNYGGKHDFQEDDNKIASSVEESKLDIENISKYSTVE